MSAGDHLVGHVIAERYRLESVLGAGGMGAVYEATQLNLGRSVAVKVMHGPALMATESRARFEREARVTAALHHPGAVKIFDFGEDADVGLYLVMEKLRGTTLRSFVAPDRPPLAVARTVDIGMQISDVLIAAHEIGLVHRDLKPENIFLEQHQDGSDRVVVVDFGLAYIEQRPDASRMTQEGVIAGTPYYMAPEQCAGSNIGTPADIYALGCMLYEMTTSVTPFEGNSFVLITKHVFEQPERPGSRRADIHVPRALDQLVMDMLGKDPSARPTADAVLTALGRLSATLGERERARGRELLEGRAARMIPTVRTPGEREATLHPEEVSTRPTMQVRSLAWVGAPIHGDLDTGLRVNGLAPVAVSGPPLPADTAAIFAPGADDALLRQLVAFGLPVLTDAAPDDLERVSRMVGLGVADVVAQPLRADTLAAKVQRAVRKHARRR